MTRNSPRMKMMMFAFAPRALITACLAASVKSVIQVSETSSAAGRVNLKTLNIINSRFGLAKSQSEPALDSVGFHSAFCKNLDRFQARIRGILASTAHPAEHVC